MTDRTPDLIVERIARGELPGSEAPDASEALERIERSNDEILEQYPPKTMAAAIERRLKRSASCEGPPIRFWQHFAIGAPVAVAAALLMLLIPMGPHPADPGVRLKGGPQIVVQRATESGKAEPLGQDSTAREGDQLQLGYRVPAAEGTLYGVVISIDGAGTVTRHLPSSSRAAALEPQTLKALPHSYVLDAAPDFERFFLVTSNAPFDTATVVNAAKLLAKRGYRRTGRLELPSGFTQTSLLIRKE